MKSRKIVSVALPIELVQTIDQCRKDISRSKFMQRLLERGFDAGGNKTRPDFIQKRDFENNEFSDEATKDNSVLRKDADERKQTIVKNKTDGIRSSIKWLR